MSIGEYLADVSAPLPDSMPTHIPQRTRRWVSRHHDHRRMWRALNDDEEDEVAVEVERRARLDAKREAAIPRGRVPMGSAFTAVRPPHPQARPTDPGVEVALQVLILRGTCPGSRGGGAGNG